MVDSKKHIRVCALDKTEYKYCNNCSEYDHMEPWHLRWCSANCKDIDIILSNWGAHLITSAEAAEQLKAHDLSRMEYWSDNYKAAYNQLMAEANGKPEEENFLDKFKAIEKETVEKEEVEKEDVVEAAVKTIEKAFDVLPDDSSDETKHDDVQKKTQKHHNNNRYKK